MAENKKYVVGLNASFHDASVCVLELDAPEPVMLLSEDRHSGRSHHFGFPHESLAIALDAVGAANVTAVGYSRDRQCFRSPPENYFSTLLDAEENARVRAAVAEICDETEAAFPDIRFLPARIDGFVSTLKTVSDLPALRKRLCYLVLRFLNELRVEARIREVLPHLTPVGLRHHDTHAATYFASPFDDACIISWDGRGEFESTVLSHGKGECLTRVNAIEHPHSIGTFYEVFSEYVGLGRVEGPGKLMGLAAYGDDRFVQLFDDLIQIPDDAFAFTLHREYLDFSHSKRMTPTEPLIKAIGPARSQDEPLSERHAAIAFAVQRATERACCRLAENGCRIVGTRNLVLSGGLSLNCVMNERIRATLNVEPFLLPASGDDGTALGAAVLLKRDALDATAAPQAARIQSHGTYGTANDVDATRRELAANGIAHTEGTAGDVARQLADGKVVGFISGKYEFGPRALGFRSILADPRPKENWKYVNDAIKFREDFRPFAPVMLRAEVDEYWGDQSTPTSSPYMLLAPTMNDHAAQTLGAVTHVDKSARVQTLEDSFNPALHAVITAFKEITGVGVLLNTSLNMSGESIIIHHMDLLRFMAFSRMDAVYLDGLLVERAGNEDALARFVRELKDRSGYLEHRRKRYADLFSGAEAAFPHESFDEFFSFLYGFPPSD